MLDDGEAEPGAADLLGVALVYAIEALENTLLFFLRDADSRVCHGNGDLVSFLLDSDRDGAPLTVIFDGVVHQVIYGAADIF